MTDKQGDRSYRSATILGICVALGIGIGVALNATAIGVAIGAGIGAALSFAGSPAQDETGGSG